jgi:hypothetical protein
MVASNMLLVQSTVTGAYTNVVCFLDIVWTVYHLVVYM